MHNRFEFIGSDVGPWRVTAMTTVCGAGLARVGYLSVAASAITREPPKAGWVLSGLKSNVRYATRGELGQLQSRQEPLDRPTASRAALIPIRKAAAWWDLAQDERRAIFEELSHHTAIGLEYLPAIARQLYHCRDLAEPFDFLTWFEYAPENESAFNHLLDRLRKSREWTYIEREIDIRLERP